MAYQPRAAILPPNRSWWVKAIPNAQRRTHLLVEELACLQSIRGGDDGNEIRGFVARFRKATGDGNPIGLELEVRGAKGNMAVIFAHIPGVGAASWFPALVVPMSPRISRVVVETGKASRFPVEPPKRDTWGEDEDRPRGGPEKVAIRIVGS
jgi:hypothetical protein